MTLMIEEIETKTAVIAKDEISTVGMSMSTGTNEIKVLPASPTFLLICPVTVAGQIPTLLIDSVAYL
jgi:hypothetical protein